MSVLFLVFISSSVIQECMTQLKMGKESKQRFPQIKYMNGQSICEKMLYIISHQENEIALHIPTEMAKLKRLREQMLGLPW